MVTTNVVGIDPGKNGGFAKLSCEGKLIEYGRTPCKTLLKKERKEKKQDNERLAELLFGTIQEGDKVVIEDVWSHPGEGSCSAFDFGYNTGSVSGIVNSIRYVLRQAGKDIEIEHMTPMKWKKVLNISGKGKTRDEVKKASVERVNNTYNIRLPLRDDGIADAILIAEAVIKENTDT